MIIFDLAALANDEHRRHFIEPTCKECNQKLTDEIRFDLGWHCYYPCDAVTHDEDRQPDYKAYYDACGGDEPVKAMESVYELTAYSPFSGDSQIWSSRCESTREKTLDWIVSNFYWDTANRDYLNGMLKMRPIGLECSQERLFEHWLVEENVRKLPKMEIGQFYKSGEIENQIKMVFTSHKPTIQMFRKRGVFVFDCNQEKE